VSKIIIQLLVEQVHNN